MFIYQTASPKFIYRKDSKLDANHMGKLTKLCKTVQEWDNESDKTASRCCDGNKTGVGHDDEHMFRTSTQDGWHPAPIPNQSNLLFMALCGHITRTSSHKSRKVGSTAGLQQGRKMVSTWIKKLFSHQSPFVYLARTSWAWSRPEVSHSSHTTMQIAIFPSCFRCLLKHPFQRFASIVYAHNKHKVLVKQKRGDLQCARENQFPNCPVQSYPAIQHNPVIAHLPHFLNTRCQHSAIMKGGTQSKSKTCIQKYWKEAAHTCKQSRSGKTW